jgi:hypothetical protein
MTATAPRRSDRATWVIGLIDGILLGVLGIEFGIIGLAVLLAIALTMVVFRNPVMLSGYLIGAGGIWVVLLGRAALLSCSEPGRSAAESCPSPGLTAYMLVGAAILAVGIAVGLIVRRRAQT